MESWQGPFAGLHELVAAWETSVAVVAGAAIVVAGLMTAWKALGQQDVPVPSAADFSPAELFTGE